MCVLRKSQKFNENSHTTGDELLKTALTKLQRENVALKEIKELHFVDVGRFFVPPCTFLFVCVW